MAKWKVFIYNISYKMCKIIAYNYYKIKILIVKRTNFLKSNIFIQMGCNLILLANLTQEIYF